jgi:uncharacterized phiE125 gp8 family phage protein
VTDLTTVAAVKAYLGLATVADDAQLQSLVTAYSQFVRSWTGRDFTVQTYDLWRSGRGQVMLMTPQWPIVGIAALTIDGRDIPAAASFGAYGYSFADRMVTLSGGATFSMGANNIHLAYSAGFSSVPADVAQAVNELVALRYKMRDKLEWSSKSLAGETVTLVTKDMPDSVKSILRMYQNNVPV